MNTAKSIIAAAMLFVFVFPGTTRAGKPEFKVKPEHLEGMSRAMQQEVGGLQYVLNPYQMQQLLSLSNLEDRREWIDVVWRSKDPTPTTEKNEMQIEHNIRVRLARQFFKSDKWPGWDKRGEVFIRYGPPTARGIIHAEITARKVHPPGEFWFYKRHGMIVSFRDQSLKGEYIYSIDPLGAAENISPELIDYLLYDTDNSLEQTIPSNLLEFYKDTEIDPDAVVDWSPLKEAISGPRQDRYLRPRMVKLTERLDADMNTDFKDYLPPDITSELQRDKIIELANNFEVVMEETPSAYPFNFEDTRFPFFFGLDQFKGGNDVNRVEVNIEFPVEANTEARAYKATAVFFDASFTEVAREDREIVLPAGLVNQGETRLMPTQLVFSLPRDYYRVAVNMSDEHTGRYSAYRSTLTYKDFTSDLAISDVLFARKIDRADRQSPFIRGPLEVIPHPVRRYAKGAPVPVYFEVYNLSVDEDGVSSYTIEYRIVPHSTKKSRFWERFRNETPVASSRFQSSGYGSDEPLHIKVGTDNLWEGAFDFLITVKDDYSQSTAFRKATFRIVK